MMELPLHLEMTAELECAYCDWRATVHDMDDLGLMADEHGWCKVADPP